MAITNLFFAGQLVFIDNSQGHKGVNSVQKSPYDSPPQKYILLGGSLYLNGLPWLTTTKLKSANQNERPNRKPMDNKQLTHIQKNIYIYMYSGLVIGTNFWSASEVFFYFGGKLGFPN